MSPVPLHQCNNSWQPQPKLCRPFRGPSQANVKKDCTKILVESPANAGTTESASSLAVTNELQSIPDSLKPENVENGESKIQCPGLRQLIISRIRNGIDGPELEVFSNVSEEDYMYVLEVIGSDCKVVRRPSYIPRLQKLIAILPSPIHEAILVPLRTAMGIAINSLTIPEDFDVFLPIHMARMVDAPATSDLPNGKYRLGIPDLVLMLQTRDDDILPLWPFEVSVSETSESAVERLQTYGDRNENVIAATHISIVEGQKHIPPTYEWGLQKELDQRGVQLKDLARSEDGRVTSFSHTWFHPTTITITTWIRSPNKRLDLNVHHGANYATAVLYPCRDDQGLEKVQRIFRRTLERVRDKVVSHLQTEHAQDQALLPSLEVVRNWSPPSQLLDWKQCHRNLRGATKQTGFDRYRSWHSKFLKHVADEEEESVPSTGTSKRAKRG